MALSLSWPVQMPRLTPVLSARRSAQGVNAMVRMSRKVIAVSVIALGALGTPAVGSAQDCEREASRRVVYDDNRRAAARPAVYRNRSAARPSTVQYEERRYEEREPERSTSKTALMVGGSAAAGAGVGGVLGGTKGALIGAAIGGGSAAIYEATKRR